MANFAVDVGAAVSAGPSSTSNAFEAGLTRRKWLVFFCQFAVGVAILHEAMPLERWVGFGLVWVALVILSVDAIVATKRQRK